MRKLTYAAIGSLLFAAFIPLFALANNGERLESQTGLHLNADKVVLDIRDDNNNKDADVQVQAQGQVQAELGKQSADKNGDDKDKDRGDKDNNNENNEDRNPQAAFRGTVTATSTAGFTLQTKDNGSFTVNTGSAIIVKAFGQPISLADITVGSSALVKGEVSGSVISAKKVIVSPANTHPAAGKGIVTATSGNSFTLRLNHNGIVSSATVNTNASTTVTRNGTSTTAAAITVGSKVSVRGLWDEILNVLNAIRVKIF